MPRPRVVSLEPIAESRMGCSDFPRVAWGRMIAPLPPSPFPETLARLAEWCRPSDNRQPVVETGATANK